MEKKPNEDYTMLAPLETEESDRRFAEYVSQWHPRVKVGMTSRKILQIINEDLSINDFQNEPKNQSSPSQSAGDDRSISDSDAGAV